MRAEEWDKKVERGQGHPECQTGDTKEKDDSTNRCAKYLILQKNVSRILWMGGHMIICKKQISLECCSLWRRFMWWVSKNKVKVMGFRVQRPGSALSTVVFSVGDWNSILLNINLLPNKDYSNAFLAFFSRIKHLLIYVKKREISGISK